MAQLVWIATIPVSMGAMCLHPMIGLMTLVAGVLWSVHISDRGQSRP